MERIVVVGHGIAGLTAADTLRDEGFAGEIVLVGDEPHAAYSRPALSKALLRDAEDVTSHELPPADHGAVERLGVAATGLDPQRREVRLSTGERLAYDGLVIASGCRPRRLGPEGADELTLRTVDEALALRGRIRPGLAVVVVGGGPLGMEVASGCLESGCQVTVVSQGLPLAVQLGGHLARWVVDRATACGLRVVETAGASIRGTGDETVVLTAEGEVLRSDLVVTAAGDLPNVEWLVDSGLLTDGVLVADDRGRVADRIVAAGDVAAFPGPSGPRRTPLWTSAVDQAKVAARALLRGDDAAALQQRPYFWTEQFGVTLKMVGEPVGDGEPTVVDGDLATDSALLRWETTEGSATVAAVNYRIPVPRLRRLVDAVPA